MSEIRTGLRLTEEGEGLIRKILTDYDGTVIIDGDVLPQTTVTAFGRPAEPARSSGLI